MPSLSDKAYYQIKRKIVSLEMPPGHVVDESALKTELKMGRTPIREALQRLAREDLIHILPRRGIFVSDISVTDLRQIFEARIPMEMACARLAAERVTPTLIASMEALVQQIPDCCEQQNPQMLMYIDQQLHELLGQAANSKFLADGLEWLYTLSLRVWHLTVDQMGAMANAMREHEALVDALKHRDPDAAERAIGRHLTDFQNRVRSVL